MSFTLHVRQVGDVAVIDMTGRVTLERGSTMLGNALREIVGKDHKKILVNLGQVSYLDSAAIGELVLGCTVASKHGGQVKLFGLTKRVKNVLLVTKTYTVFDVHEDEAAAIGSFT